MNEGSLDKVRSELIGIIVGIQTSGPPSDLKQPGGEGSVQQETKSVADPLPQVNDYKTWVS